MVFNCFRFQETGALTRFMKNNALLAPAEFEARFFRSDAKIVFFIKQEIVLAQKPDLAKNFRADENRGTVNVIHRAFRKTRDILRGFAVKNILKHSREVIIDATARSYNFIAVAGKDDCRTEDTGFRTHARKAA